MQKEQKTPFLPGANTYPVANKDRTATAQQQQQQLLLLFSFCIYSYLIVAIVASFIYFRLNFMCEKTQH